MSSRASSLRHLVCTLFLVLSICVVLQGAGTEAPPRTALQNEGAAIIAAHEAARAGKDAEADTQLETPALGALSGVPASLTLARRATAVCGWLKNENDRTSAAQVARRTLARLASMSEAAEADRVERLICEATLEVEFLDNKKRGLALLQVAEKLAPGDERITRMEAGLVAALEAFGN